MLVGTKAIGTLSTGYLTALDYAKQRVQGADLARMADKSAPRVPIIAHPDVRRMLMLQKAYAEGLRALYLYTASFAGPDPAAAGRRGRRRAAAARQRPAAADRQGRRVGAGQRDAAARRCRPSAARATCRTTRSSSTSATPRSIRCTRAPPRSSRSTCCSARSSGTTGGRWAWWSPRSRGSWRPDAARRGNGRLKEERVLLATALADVQGMLGRAHPLVGASAVERHVVQGRPAQRAAAAGAWATCWSAGCCCARPRSRCRAGRPGPARDQAFYQGKVGRGPVLRQHGATAADAPTATIVEHADNTLMDVPEAAF